MNKKSITALLGGVVLLVVAVFIVVKYFEPTIERITEDKGSAETSNLANKKAIIYISKDAEKLEKGSAEGQLVFIDKNYKTKIYTISPVEYGGTVVQQDELLIEQANSMILAKDKVKTTEFETPEYRSLRTSYLKGSQQYYAIYNSGLSKTEDYKMTVRYSNNNGEFKSLFIPHFVSAAGEADDEVVLLTQDLISYEFQLRTVALKNNAKVKLILKLPIKNPTDLDAVSQVLVDDSNYYFVASDYKDVDRENINLYTINRKTNQMTQKKLAKYQTVQETESSLPLTYNDSLHKWEDNLYYTNGAGKVYRYGIKTNKVTQVFSLKSFPVEDSYRAQVQYKNHFIYAIYQAHDKKIYLDVYNLLTGKRNTHEKINGLEKYLQKDSIMTNLNIVQ